MTRRQDRPWYLLLSLLLTSSFLAGCDAITGICPDCIPGLDLIVDEVTVAEAVFVEELQRHAVAAGTDIRVTVAVRNRGTERSDQVELSVCVSSDPDYCGSPLASTTISLPPLNSNERVTREITLSLPANRSASPGGVRARIEIYDEDRTNDVKVLPLRVERPNFVPQVELLTSEAQVGTTIRAVARIRNVSYVAGAAPTAFHVCSMRYSWTAECDGVDRLELALPSVAARVVFEDTVDYVVPQSLLSYPDQGVSTLMGVCVDPLGAISAENQESCVRGEYSALPNLELACGATPIEGGQSVSGELAAGDCSLSFGSYVDLYRMDAGANSTWNITLNSVSGGDGWVGMRVLTERGSALSPATLWSGETYAVTMATAGTYYLAVHRSQAATYSFQVNP